MFSGADKSDCIFFMQTGVSQIIIAKIDMSFDNVVAKSQ